MTSQDDPNPQGSSSAANDANESLDLAQAYRELARGEQAASTLEANLTNLESKLDAMLAAFEGIVQDTEGDDQNAGKQGQDGKEKDKGKKDGEGTS